MPRTRRIVRCLLFAAWMVAPVSLWAQTADCDRLYGAIQAADNNAHGRQWDRAAEQQRNEIERTQRYADQIGCATGASYDQDGDQPGCSAITDRLQRMHDNLSHLEAQADQAQGRDSGPAQDALVARYNALCVGGGNPADSAARGGFFSHDTLPPAPIPDGSLRDDGDGVSAVAPGGDIIEENPASPLRGQPICVRSCDGGYFPLDARPTDTQPSGLEQLCQASCPNTETKLYTMAKGGELSSATALDGSPYSSLPAAFKFEKSFSPSCSCKPPNQSWAQALANAEALLDTSHSHDVTVTASMSDDMARAAAAPPPSAPKAGRTGKRAKGQPASPDTGLAGQAQKGTQAPSTTSAIGGVQKPGKVLREGHGAVISDPGPDGVSRRVRLISP